MGSNRLEPTVRSLLQTTLSDAGDGALVVGPPAETIEGVVDVMSGVEDPPPVRLLAETRTVTDVMEDFIVASGAAELLRADRLAIRTTDERPTNPLVVTDDAVVAIVPAADHVAGLVTDDDAFVESAADHYGEVWAAAEPFDLRTPPLSAARESLSESVDPGTRGDFDAILASLDTARGDGDGLDEVVISLLAGAKNGQLLYDLSRWGEDVGLASKATFSRTKSRLEDTGLIETEKVPIDVGRPRQRLRLADERLCDADPDQIASVAQSVLASG